MGFMRVVLLAFVAAVLAYYAYNPLPSDIEQPLLVSVHLSVWRIMGDLSKLSQIIGWKKGHVMHRQTADLLTSLYSRQISEGIQATDTEFAGIPVRVYRPSTKAETPSPGLVFIHGGGFVFGTLSDYDKVAAEIVLETGITVVSVEYRLAPEHPSPAALDDCLAASSHFFQHAADWGVDASNIGVGGDSAGGNLAAALSLRRRDMGGRQQFAYQVLIYPWLQAMDFHLPSSTENHIYNTPTLKPYGLAYLTSCYMGIGTDHISKIANNQHISKPTRAKYTKIMDFNSIYYDGKNSEPRGEIDEDLAKNIEEFITNPYNFPLMADGLEGVPPDLVITAGYDTLRDEGLLFFNRLKKAGVEAQYYEDELCWHFALMFAAEKKSVCGRRILDNVIRYINTAKVASVAKKSLP